MAIDDPISALREFDRNPATAGRALRDALHLDRRYFLRIVARAAEFDGKDRGLRYAMLLLLHNDLLIPAIVSPSETSLEEALRLTRNMLKLDFNFMNELLRIFPTRSELFRDTPSVLRILDIVENCVEHVANWRSIVRIHEAGDGRIKVKCARLIAQYRFENPAGLESFCSADPRIRANIIEILWGVDKPNASMVLEAAKHDANSRVAGNAWLGQYTSGSAGALSGMAAMLESPEPSRRKTAIWAMGQSRDGRFSGSLLNLAQRDTPEIREAANSALSMLDPIPDSDWGIAALQVDPLDVTFVSAPCSVFPPEEETDGFELWLSVTTADGQPARGLRPVDFFVGAGNEFILDYSIEERTCADGALGIVYPAGSEPLLRAFKDSIRSKAASYRWAVNSYGVCKIADGVANPPRFEANAATLSGQLDSGPPSSEDSNGAIRNILAVLNTQQASERHLLLIVDEWGPVNELELIQSHCRENNIRLHCWCFRDSNEKPPLLSDLPEATHVSDETVSRGARRFWEIDEGEALEIPIKDLEPEMNSGEAPGLPPLLPGIVRDEVQSAVLWPAFVASLSHRYVLRARQLPNSVAIRRIGTKSVRFSGRTRLLPEVPK